RRGRPMSEEAAFLSAIAAGDDVARLAYADWLEERGDPKAAWVRDRALCTWMMPDGRCPIAPLIEAAADENNNVKEFARCLLPRLGAAVIPHLMERIERDEGALWAGEALGEMGRGLIAPLLLRLRELMDADSRNIAVPAALALKVLGPEAVPDLPALL